MQALEGNMGAFIGEGFKAPYVLRMIMPPEQEDRAMSAPFMDLPRAPTTSKRRRRLASGAFSSASWFASAYAYDDGARLRLRRRCTPTPTTTVRAYAYDD